MNQSEQINELAAALAKAQAKLQPVIKDKTAKIPTKSGGSYAYAYADLSSVWEAIRAALTENGIAVIQMPELTDAGLVNLTTMLTHSSGQWVRSAIATRPSDTTPQAIGSAITYARRYALSAMVGVVADDDDDGAAASQPRQAATYEPQQGKAPRLPSQQAAAPQQPADEAREAAAKAYAYISEQLGRPVTDMPTLNRALGTTFPEPQTLAEWRKLAAAARDIIAAMEPAGAK